MCWSLNSTCIGIYMNYDLETKVKELEDSMEAVNTTIALIVIVCLIYLF